MLFVRRLSFSCLALATCGGLGSAVAPAVPGIKNIILVHGAWVDGSGWQPVYNQLVRDGYTVSVVQQPLTSLADDVAATRRVLAMQTGPCILVAHSYGGTIITEVGLDAHVAGLVYIAAHMPNVGENEAALGQRYPSDLSKSTAVRTTSDGFKYLDPAHFPAYFAADLPRPQAEFEARSQMLTAAAVFTAPLTVAAWQSKPSWMLVAGADRVISPELERWYAARAHCRRTVEVAGASHSVYESHPQQVVALIEEAAHTSQP